ncbi:hypothetical protein F5050DRAFT_1326762 [Lentinula boryana]|uniref:Ubiquitin-like domain-containing protein n=1 Tax=Lentinula boryana TaxID=40481 RepID=A0ABQ8QSP8_9AGAR|nr:hypothetical protein F5050DRAFT_1326762 [Lentinula boryana]
MDVPQTPGKRKRETNAPRITYYTANRTFDRLFKEESLDETRDVVRRKLGLPDSSNIRLAQIRGEHTVDLEDDDDFDAFYAIAHSKMAIEVQVSIGDMSPPHARSSPSPAVVDQKAVSPTALNVDLPFLSSGVPDGPSSRETTTSYTFFHFRLYGARRISTGNPSSRAYSRNYRYR